MNFLTRKSFLSSLDSANYELARQQLLQAGFEINNILSVPVFGKDKTLVDGILSAIEPISGQGNGGSVSMVDYGSFAGGRQTKK